MIGWYVFLWFYIGPLVAVFIGGLILAPWLAFKTISEEFFDG